MHMPYRTRHLWKDRLGDAYIIVSPSIMALHICDPEINHWIMSQRERFVKCTPIYAVLGLFGPNLVTTEGHEWRRHRRLTAGSFNEANTALVFKESIRQSLGMLRKWTGNDPEASGSGPVKPLSSMLTSAEDDIIKLTLHIISYVGFGLQMLWPGETLPKDANISLAKFSSPTAPAGYQVPFLEAIAGVLHHITYVLVFPLWLLECMPFKTARQAGIETRDYLKYTDELLEKRLADDRQAGQELPGLGMDFLGHLVRKGNNGSGLDRTAIIGNTFILQLAGHETVANALFHTIVFLACFPAAQRRVQADLDAVLGDAEPSTWEYGKVVDALLATNVGAAIFETLRMLPAAVALPKMAVHDEVVHMDGKQYTIPGGMPVFLETLSTAMDPRYWPTRPSRYGTGGTDIHDYLPERWFRECGQEARGAAKNRGPRKDGKTMHESADDAATTNKLFRPVAGAYAPFSDGARSCPGRRIAQTELMAALAVLFRGHSIELVVNEDVQERSAERALYAEARRRTLETLKTVRLLTTLRLADGQQIGLGIAKRGEERFVGWMD